MTIEQYRKKPVTIEAVQWTGSNLREVITFTDGPPDTRTQHAGMMWENYEDLVRRDGLKIFTLEGAMLASPGDWIVKGVKGEFYPCKPDIFAATYEPAALRREREPVEPQRCAECDCESGGPDCNWIKWDPQPDALALVAAAYRDAADWLLDMRAVDDDGNETTPEADVYVTLINSLPKRTPADAQAALTAIERAAYERGVRDAAKACDWGDIYGDNAVRCILDLLTQEGR